MKKFTEFLEKNCQWIAIGLGALWMLWMGWSYIPGSTWSVPVGAERKTPGDVDESVAAIAQQLKEKIDHPGQVNFKVPNFSLDPHPARPVSPPAVAWANSPTQDVVANANNPAPNNGNGPPAPGVVLVTELPNAPAPTDLSIIGGRSNMGIPAPTSIVPAGAAAAATPTPAAPLPPVDTDGGWETIAFKISIGDLAKEFKRVGVPDANYSDTAFLTVELVRQEKLADGTWGPETICPKLTTSTQPPFPAADAKTDELNSYLNWAKSKSAEILQPSFYTINKGDPWSLPKALIGGPADNAPPLVLGPNDIRPGFDPNSYVNATPPQLAAVDPPLTSAEKRAIAKATQDAKEKAKPKPTPRPTPGQTTPKGGSRFSQTYLFPREEGGTTPGLPQPGAPGIVAQPAQPGAFASMFPLPPGEFDPRKVVNVPPQPNVNPDTIVGWAHDAKPEEGKTYRYKVRYEIKNPLWTSQNRTNPAKLAEQFAIVSRDSDWTPEVQVKSSLSFFFTSSGFSAGSKIPIEIYKWQNGQTHKERFYIAPGDLIGGEKNSIDYSTGYVLVDLRPSAKNDSVTAWLLTPDGAIIQREVKGDLDSPQRKELEKEIAPPPSLTPGGAPPPPAPGAQPPPPNRARPTGPRL